MGMKNSAFYLIHDPEDPIGNAVAGLYKANLQSCSFFVTPEIDL
ncbi:hypothetical protein [uncultured Chryseobacterium sp.]|nr:hypothetical protein [uncultured Chryseobacterium sp.]